MSAGTHETTGGELSIQHEEDARGGAFFVDVGGERLAEMTYVRPSAGRAVIEHTRVSDRLGGRGVGKRLVHAGVEWARAAGAKLTPRCPYARSVIERDPSLQDVLDTHT
ncbi:MAG TPA: GNAT family N-acetyltransferase [Anaeromyxobacter sp.]|nr:GNAT family N-acetyltransferase [Anaeromyxobacter sp.]